MLVFALSTMGKTYLAERFPELIYDTDRALDEATDLLFPGLPPLDRRRAWRRFCQTKPWENQSHEFKQWVAVRKAYVAAMHEAMSGTRDVLILTSEFSFQWPAELYVGVELGAYERHIKLVGKNPDNGQAEWMNQKIEACQPLIRVPPGSHLSDVQVIKEWLHQRTEA